MKDRKIEEEKRRKVERRMEEKGEERRGEERKVKRFSKGSKWPSTLDTESFWGLQEKANLLLLQNVLHILGVKRIWAWYIVGMSIWSKNTIRYSLELLDHYSPPPPSHTRYAQERDPFIFTTLFLFCSLVVQCLSEWTRIHNRIYVLGMQGIPKNSHGPYLSLLVYSFYRCFLCLW